MVDFVYIQNSYFTEQLFLFLPSLHYKAGEKGEDGAWVSLKKWGEGHANF